MSKYRILRYIKYFIASIIIVICTYYMLALNSNFSLASVANLSFVRDKPKLAETVTQTQWNLTHYAWLFGLQNYWRMFAPPDTMNWDMLFTAIYADGTETLLDETYHQKQRSFFESNFKDFREAKFQLNIYNDPAGQQAYVAYLCKTYSRPGNRVESIRIDLDYHTILSPSQAKSSGRFVSDSYINEHALHQCPYLEN